MSGGASHDDVAHSIGDAMGRLIRGCSTLTALDVSYQPLGLAGVKPIFEAMRQVLKQE